MSKRKRIEPAAPVAKDPRIRRLERDTRRKIAKLKETDMDAGRKESLSVSAMMSDLDTVVERGDKAIECDRKRTDAAHGTRSEREARWRRIADTYADLKSKHPNWKEKQLDAETAGRCGVSVRTVRSYKHKPTE